MTPLLLVSEQTLPNLLFLKQFGPFERYIFLSTGRMERDGRSRWIAQTAGIPEAAIDLKLVDPEQPGSAIAALEGLGLPDSEPVLAFVTGGTKMMLLGTYAWASQRSNAEILYLPIGSDHFLRIFPESAELPLRARVSLEEYLAVHGVQVLSKGNWHRWWPIAVEVFDNLTGQSPSQNIQRKLDWSRQEGIAGTSQEEKEEKKFYSGDWLEVYLAGRLQDLFGIPSPNIAQNVRVNKSGPSNSYSNEYDILFVLDNRLHIGECKFFTGSKHRAIGDIRQELHKLADANNLLGLFAQPFFGIIHFVNGQPEPFIKAANRESWEELARLLRLNAPIELDTMRVPERLASAFRAKNR